MSQQPLTTSEPCVAQPSQNYCESSAANKTLVSCVIPCYRSELSVGQVVSEIELAFESRSAEYDYEIILVNDASPDGTLQVIERLAAGDAHVVAADLARNFGQQSAIMAGFSLVRGDIVVVLDDDMQCPPSEMFKLIDVLVNEKKDIVYASYGHREHAGWRNLGSRFNTWCNRKFCRVPNDLQVNNYYAVRRYVVDCALNYQNPYPYIEGLLMQAVRTYANVEITHNAREFGESGYNMHRLLTQWFNGVTLFSVYPLRIATALGFLISLVGLVFACFVVVQRILDPSITEGWSSLMAAQMFIGGLILFSLGIVGEYIGRIYLSLNHMPQYIIRNVRDSRGE